MNLLIVLQNYDDADALWDVHQLALLAKKHSHRLVLLTMEQEVPRSIQHALKLLPCPPCVFAPANQFRFQRAFDRAMDSGQFDASIAFSFVKGADFYVPRRFFATGSRRHRATCFTALCRSQTSSYFTFVTDWQGIRLLRDGGVPRARCFQIDPEFRPEHLPHHDPRGRFQLRRALDVPEKHFLILQCADDWQRQGVDHSLAALARLPAVIRSICHYALLSSNGSQYKLAALAEKHGFNPARVVHLGNKRALTDMLAVADLMLHLAREEEAGTMLVDALTANVPVVCSENCGYSYFLKRTSCPVIPMPFRAEVASDALGFALQNLDRLRNLLPGEFARLHLRGRTRQLLHALENKPPLRRKMLEPAVVREIVALHARNLLTNHALKNERKRAASRVVFNGARYLVKEFKKREWWHLGSCARRTERGTRLLTLYTPQVCGKFRDVGNGSDYLVFPDCGDGNFFLTGYATREDAAQLYGECGMLLAELHDAGIYHQDAKPANFVLNEFCRDECTQKVCLVDCDNVIQMAAPLNLQTRVHNLAQFIAGTGNLARMDRQKWKALVSAFCDGYGDSAFLPMDDLDRLWQNVWQAIEKRAHIEYTLPDEVSYEDSTKIG